jgi:hypothetical protein
MNGFDGSTKLGQNLATTFRAWQRRPGFSGGKVLTTRMKSQ